MSSELRSCRGYQGATYQQERHLVPAEAFYVGKTQCRDCYRAYAADWRAGRRPAARGSAAIRRAAVLDGVSSLRTLLARAGYPTIVAAVAEHTVFLPPSTVEQTGGAALFRTARDYARRGQLGSLVDGRRVMLDDNASPTDAFLWSAGLAKGPDVQFNHVWSLSRDPDAYTALWNVCATPAFLAKTTDGSNHPEVQAALRYRAYELYGRVPTGQTAPTEPAGYSALRWAPHAPAVMDLESELRLRLRQNTKSRTAISCREIGWLFSNWAPDPSI